MKPGSRQTRVLLLFLLGIVLPSALLGYLAFRGIQNDQALLEKNRAESLRRTADLVTRGFAELVKTNEDAFLAVLPGLQDASDAALALRLAQFTSEHPLVEEVFAWRSPNAIRFPAGGLLFLPPGAAASARGESRLAPFDERARAAARLEFGRQDYPAAIAAYEQALTRATDVQARAEMLAALARVQKKAGRLEDAETSYRRIARDFGQARSASGLPLGLAARLELASLLGTSGETDASLETYIDTYSSLVEGTWPLEEAQYDFCVRQIGDGIEQALSRVRQDPRPGPLEARFASLKEKDRKERAAAERLLAFSLGAAPEMEARVGAGRGTTAGAFRRFVLDTGGRSYFISLVVRTATAGPETGDAWGLLFGPGPLEDALHRRLATEASSEDAAWVVRGADEKVILASQRTPAGTSVVRARFDDDFPNWTLEFYQLSPSRLTALLGARQGIYLYMFLLIAGILVFGLILTVRTVSHEMDLAKMKSDFVSTVSHEFKSPLTSIQQVAEMLQAGRVPSENRRQQYYDLLLEQSQRLCLLTDNILNLARIEEGRKRFAFERLDVRALLEAVVATVRDRVRHEGFALDLKMDETLPDVMADRESLAQAVTNLLDNAVKYSGKSRAVIVRAYVQDRHLVVSITDFGIGIRKEEAGRVFDRFYRGGDELTRSVKGSGLGLTLVKEIVEAHHGTVGVESEVGKGSTFTVLLPLKEQEPGLRGKAPNSP